MRECILGIDAGGTAIKATLFSLLGQVIANESVQLLPNMMASGRVERNLADIDNAMINLINSILQKSQTDPNNIAVIAATGHGNGLYCLDRHGSGLIGIQSTDSHAADVAQAMANSTRGKAISAISLQEPWPAQTPTILAALKKLHPELYRQIGTIFLCKDYINYFLTTEISSETTDMSGAGMLHLPNLVYNEDLLKLYGINDLADSLPSLASSEQVIGVVSENSARLTGLVAGTPVIAGLFDVVASAIGSNLFHVGDVNVIAGTWSINQVLSAEISRENRPFITCGYPGGLFLNLEASATSASNLEWLIQNILVGSNDRSSGRTEILQELDSILDSHKINLSSPFFLPFLHGGDSDPRALATFHNLTAMHNRNHMISAVCEGINFSHRRHLDTLAAKGFSIGPIVVTGGAARSQSWMRMLAAAIGKPVATLEKMETGTLGAAITGAVGVGLFNNYKTAATSMASARSEIQSDPDQISMAMHRYSMSNQLIDALTPIWRSIHKVNQ